MTQEPIKTPKKKRNKIIPPIPPSELILQNNEAKYHPDKDGVDHINIHIWSKTPLGRRLASETECYFNHPEFGPFKSIEGFHFWITHYNVPDIIREAHGRKLHERFGSYKPRRIGNIKELLISAHIAKISQNQDLKRMLKECTLPFTSYYVNKTGLIITLYKREYLITLFDSYRRHLRENKQGEFIFPTSSVVV